MSDLNVAASDLNEWRMLARYQATAPGYPEPRPIRHIVGICLVGGSKCVIVRRATGRVIRRIRAVNSADARVSHMQLRSFLRTLRAISPVACYLDNGRTRTLDTLNAVAAPWTKLTFD